MPPRRVATPAVTAALRLVAFAAVVALPAAIAAEPRPQRVAVEVAAPDGERTLEGRVVAKAADGGMLLELDDQRLEVVKPGSVRSRRTLAEPNALADPKALGRRIVRELPAGFTFLVTEHYVVCHDTPRPYAEWCAALFERLHAAFLAHWEKAGLEIRAPEEPLVVVIFADRARYETFAAADLGAAKGRVGGYYDTRSNRITTFDLTRSESLARIPANSAARAGLQILSRPEAAGLVSTLVHEATHQMAFNSGLHRRMAPVPVWVAEGMATYCERGWKEIGEINKPLLDRFLSGQGEGDFDTIVVDDAPFRDVEKMPMAYARAWALTAFLARSRPEQYARYMAGIAAKPPLSPDGPQHRRRAFVEAFGAEPREFEEEAAEFLARWATRRDEPAGPWRRRGAKRAAP